MLATIAVSLFFLLAFCAAMALGQFFGREPVTPKCNPGPCCLKKEQCKRRRMAASEGGRDA